MPRDEKNSRVVPLPSVPPVRLANLTPAHASMVGEDWGDRIWDGKATGRGRDMEGVSQPHGPPATRNTIEEEEEREGGREGVQWQPLGMGGVL